MDNQNNNNENYSTYYGQTSHYYTGEPPVKSKPNNASTFIIIALVIIIMVISMIPVISFTFNGRNLSENLDNILPFLLFGIFVVIGLILTIIGILKMVGMKKRCTEKVFATCVDIDSYESYDDDGPSTTMYSPIYEIYHRGQMLRIMSKVYSSTCRVYPGERVELLINPYQPEEFLDVKGRGGVYSILILIGVVFMIIGIICGVAFSNAM